MNTIGNIDFDALAQDQSLKSHSLDEIRNALSNGQSIWLFDSGTSGNDDTLIYPEDATEDDVKFDLEEFFFLQEGEKAPGDLWDWDRPNYWSLDGPITAKEAARRWPLET